MTDTHHPPNWQARTLLALGAKANRENKRLLTAQSQAEGGSAEWNPVNSTLDLPGFTSTKNYNSVPVRNYTAATAGVCATALTFIGRDNAGKLLYPGILNDLEAGTKTAEQIVNDRRAEYLRYSGGNQKYPDLILSILKETP